jgi:hypothetical protein
LEQSLKTVEISISLKCEDLHGWQLKDWSHSTKIMCTDGGMIGYLWLWLTFKGPLELV